ncbi:hypothetical protein H6P81_015701 [Aristolochia fimbriata]|uniref:Glutaredoxin domain-containing protein n=1 Tax=Aristolochia fimbriata TaxID=158543 RepID=A0AAV7E9A5_ARIFI|nr:hypothetical protein H6P81_015701 [Aristolochia fimbriata]
MDFSLSNLILRRVGVSRATCKFRKMHGLKCSTLGYSEMRNDIQQRDRPACSGLTAKDTIEKDVRKNPILIYMKGLPDTPRCGFSSLAVRVCRHYGVPFTARNVLEDPEIKKAVKKFSNWPTFPQIFIDGVFVGGSDIFIQLHLTGKLRLKLKEMGLLPDNSEDP